MASAKGVPADLELMYWNGRGLMEVPRMLLALAGKFPKGGEGGDYVDGRYTTDEVYNDTVKPLDDAAKAKLTNWNLGRMPMLFAGGSAVGQAAAINHYLADSLGYLGSNPMEAAQIIAIQEAIKECSTAYRGVVPCEWRRRGVGRAPL